MIVMYAKQPDLKALQQVAREAAAQLTVPHSRLPGRRDTSTCPSKTSAFAYLHRNKNGLQ